MVSKPTLYYLRSSNGVWMIIAPANGGPVSLNRYSDRSSNTKTFFKEMFQRDRDSGFVVYFGHSRKARAMLKLAKEVRARNMRGN